MFKMPNKISCKSICERNKISMSDNYNEYCMKFSNEELREYLYKQISKNVLEIKCLSENGDEIDITSETKIETIAFDKTENVAIMFWEYQTSIFVYDEEFMFIDEKSKESYTSSDVYGNVVYEGELRKMSHEQMLQMFADIVLCFVDATGVNVMQSDVPENTYKSYRYFEPHIFVVNVENNHSKRKTKIFENVTIHY